MSNTRPFGPLTEIRYGNQKGTLSRLLSEEWTMDDFYSTEAANARQCMYSVAAGNFHEASDHAWIAEARRRGFEEWMNRPMSWEREGQNL
jgi:hypothetical protein